MLPFANCFTPDVTDSSRATIKSIIWNYQPYCIMSSGRPGRASTTIPGLDEQYFSFGCNSLGIVGLRYESSEITRTVLMQFTIGCGHWTWILCLHAVSFLDKESWYAPGITAFPLDRQLAIEGPRHSPVSCGYRGVLSDSCFIPSDTYVAGPGW